MKSQCKRRLMALAAAVALMFPPLLLPQPASAQQLSATATVMLRAVVHGSVTVSARTVPLLLTLDPSDPSRNYTAIPLSIKWNLNVAESQGFQVIGYFANPGAALQNQAAGVTVASSQVLGRMAAGEYRPFSDANEIGPAGGSLKLFEQSISPGNSRGKRSGMLEMRVAEEASQQLPGGLYEGMLYIEVRQY
jgi:hypothetical protein